MANWGVAAEIKLHRDLHRVINGLAKKIEFMQVDLEGARQTADLCLVGQGLCVTQQNIQAVRILRQPVHPNNNNNNKNKGKGRAL